MLRVEPCFLSAVYLYIIRHLSAAAAGGLASTNLVAGHMCLLGDGSLSAPRDGKDGCGRARNLGGSLFVPGRSHGDVVGGNDLAGGRLRGAAHRHARRVVRSRSGRMSMNLPG